MRDLQDKVVIVTGGTRGIGLATVRAFLEQGAKVVLLGSREKTVSKALNELRKEYPGVEGFWPNLANLAEVQEMVEQIWQKYGRIDVLVNNAGVSASAKIEDTSDEDFARVLDLNVRGIFHTIKAVVPHMKEQKHGVILNTSSFVSFCGQPAGAVYPASKAAVNGLTLSLARELAPYGIRVNAVAPGVTNTDMLAAVPEATREALVKTLPLGRMAEPRDVANAFLFLASEMANYITGAVLPVDGAARN